MFKKILFLVGILATAAIQSDYRIVARVDIIHNGASKTVNFEKVLSENETEIQITDDGVLLTGTVLGRDEHTISFAFDIKNIENNKTFETSVICPYGKESCAKKETLHKDTVVEEIALYVTPFQQ